jgi:MarR family transcriptional regulator, 2-MHQ and catechol-resistance regulon repressor
MVLSQDIRSTPCAACTTAGLTSRKRVQLREKSTCEMEVQFKKHFPQLDYSSIKLVGALANAHHVLFSIMERAFSKSGITPQSMEVLKILYIRKEEGYLLGEIGEQLMVSPANVPGLVEGLVKKGLVERKEQPGDRRKRLTMITPLGVEFMDNMAPVTIRFFNQVFASLSSEDKNQLSERLHQLSKMLLPYWEKRLSPDIMVHKYIHKKSPSKKNTGTSK